MENQKRRKSKFSWPLTSFKFSYILSAENKCELQLDIFQPPESPGCPYNPEPEIAEDDPEVYPVDFISCVLVAGNEAPLTEKAPVMKISTPMTYCDNCEGLSFPDVKSFMAHYSQHREQLRAECRGGSWPEEQMEPCQHFGKKFSSQENLKGHVERMHFAPREETFSCDLCQGKKSFAKKWALILHMRRIHIRNKETCQHCGKVFTCRQNLKGHIQRNHTDTATWKYECQVCDRRFFIPSTLKEHMKQHTDQRDHSCSTCQATFLNKSALQRHIRNKHNTGSFECPHCSKVFASSMYLKQHLKTHTQGGYVCPMCPGKGFSLTTTLRSHIKTKHPSLELPPPGTVLKNFDWSKIMKTSKDDESQNFEE